jgi:tRNA nucleotidyltransferase/poly(A) polymerase
MKLRDLLNIIDRISKQNRFPEPMICGGTVRDKVLNRLDRLSDIDITNGSIDIHKLAIKTINELKEQYSIKVKRFDDGHISLWLGSGKNTLKIDFSSFFILPHIDTYLQNLGIKKPTSIEREQFSRDFTINTLLMTLDLKTIKDPTHKGIKDIEQKIIRTCLDPDTTFRHNTNRIIRTIYLASKLDFDVDPGIIKWISENKAFLQHSSQQYVSRYIDKALDKNPERAIWLIEKTNLWDAIPITEKLYPYFAKKSVKEAQLKRNFDYGEGMYSAMNEGKVKSVSEFRKKRRKKRKKILDGIKKMHLVQEKAK